MVLVVIDGRSIHVEELDHDGDKLRYRLVWHVQLAGGWFTTLTFPC